MTSERSGPSLATERRCAGELDARADALRALNARHVPYVVAGAYAFFEYTGVYRDTKDLDVFLRRRDLDAALAALESAGFRTELLDPVWIAKGYRGEWFVDLIFSSGNGVAVVDDTWLARARPGVVMGVPARLAPAEEIIWSKAFVCERERYDGNDIAHLLRARGHALDWDRLLARFDEHWEVLLAHLVLYRFSFPSDRSTVPPRVMRELLRRVRESLDEGDHEGRLCRGTLLSKTQYRHVLEELGYDDVRERDRRTAPEVDQDGSIISPCSGG
jgi:hypothetical protein